MLDLYKKYYGLFFESRSCRIALAHMEMGLHISVKMHFLHYTNVFWKTMSDYQGG